MNVIAIDPGTSESAVIKWDGTTVIESGMFSNENMLSVIDREDIVIEMVACYGMAVGKDVFETCVWIGRFAERSNNHRMVYRKDIKMHLCQSARAKDANIRQALIDRFGKPGTKKAPGALYGISGHLWAALAVAVYAFDIPEGK